MKKIEKEIKVLDINVEQLRKKLEYLRATLKSDGIQKIDVYDLPSIYSRFYDCMMQLEKCSKPYDLEVCKNKLKNLFLEIDNLVTKEQQENIYAAGDSTYISRQKDSDGNNQGMYVMGWNNYGQLFTKYWFYL